MSKFDSVMTISRVCKMEVAECEDILMRYQVTEEETEVITGMIKEAYYQLWQCEAGCRALERIIDELGGLSPEEYFRIYMQLVDEEREKYPLTVDNPEEEFDDIEV